MFPTRAPLAVISLALAQFVAAPARAQTAGDVAEGKKLFDGMCARCHGVDGTGDEGPALDHPTLTRAPDDESLRTIIRDGIPDRGMPRVRRLTDSEIAHLAEYVRSIGRKPRAATNGDPDRGRAVYEKLGCAACHIVKGQGGSFGPELTEVGLTRGPGYLRQSFLGPAETLPRGISPVPGRGFTEYLPVRVVTNDQREVRGIRINEDPFTIQLRDTANVFHSFRKSELKLLDKEFGKSLMPSFRGRVTDAESDDLVAYLSTLRGGK
jgi:putative heme-binding domain-containing protein